jgi:hypothetical protein
MGNASPIFSRCRDYHDEREPRNGPSGTTASPGHSSPDPAAYDDALPRTLPGSNTTAAAYAAALSTHDAALLAVPLPPLEPLAGDLDGLDAFVLDTRLRAVVAALQAVDWEIGRLLRLLFDLRLHRMLGFPDTGSYVRERLGFSPRKAGALVAVERATWHAPALAEG